MWTVEPYKEFRREDYKDRMLNILRQVEKMLLAMRQEKAVGKWSWDNLYFSDVHHEIYVGVQVLPRWRPQARSIRITLRLNPMALTLTNEQDFLADTAERYLRKVQRILLDISHGNDKIDLTVDNT